MNPSTYSPLQKVCSVEAGAHFVQIYNDNESLIDCIFAYFDQGFDRGEAAIVIATRPHRASLEAKFGAAGYDISELKRSGQYAPFDAAETLGMFMRGGRPDPSRFNALVGGLMKSAIADRRGVRAFGEMVAIVWDEGNREGAIELERLWNELARDHSFTLFCAYRQNQFSTQEDRAGFQSVCNAHCNVIGV